MREFLKDGLCLLSRVSLLPAPRMVQAHCTGSREWAWYTHPQGHRLTPHHLAHHDTGAVGGQAHMHLRCPFSTCCHQCLSNGKLGRSVSPYVHFSSALCSLPVCLSVLYPSQLSLLRGLSSTAELVSRNRGGAQRIYERVPSTERQWTVFLQRLYLAVVTWTAIPITPSLFLIWIMSMTSWWILFLLLLLIYLYTPANFIFPMCASKWKTHCSKILTHITHIK